MNRKTIIFTAMCAISLIYAKRDYLPPLHIENIISEPVLQFLEKNQSAKPQIIASKSSRDVLGRKKGSLNQAPNYVILPEETLEVDVAYLDEDKPIENHFGRFETKNRISSYWYDGEKVSEREYIDLTESNLDTSYRDFGFRAKLTAAEIRNLISEHRKVLLANSISSDDPFEAVDFTTNSNADLTIEIWRYANSGSDNVILGYAFWEDL